MTPLEKIIRERIVADGPMPLENYMALCLSHPMHGYYQTRPAIGGQGDFITAPEISQMFGEIVGVWLAHAWALAGRPDPVKLVELGPGRGTLMSDMLRAMHAMPGLRSALRLHLVETSALMRRAQRQALAGLPFEPAWHETLGDVPGGPMLLVANEFFDALPVRQLIRRGQDWRECCIAIKAGRLAFADGSPAGDDIPAELGNSAEGAIVEQSPLGRDLAGEIGARMAGDGGAALIIDYGYRQSAAGDSLQALRGGRPADPLEAPGEADLTAHVDFSVLASAAGRAGAAVHGPLTQGSFLTALGLGLRAERLRAAGASTGDLALAVERLTGAGAMGTLFKVLALASPRLPVPPPFDPAQP